MHHGLACLICRTSLVWLLSTALVDL
jgi:hypothetical protein